MTELVLVGSVSCPVLHPVRAIDMRNGRGITLFVSYGSTLSKAGPGREGAHPRDQQLGPPSKGQLPGERWIQVHPHGDDEKGYPVLLRLSSDGSHYRVVGGAGGSLTHFKIAASSLKSEEKYKENAKEKAGEKREKQREEDAKLTPEDRKAKEMREQERKLHKKIAERKMVQQVREAGGHIRPDLPEDDIKHLPEHAQKTLIDLHHRAQVSEAKKEVQKARRKLQDAGHERIREHLKEEPVQPDDGSIGGDAGPGDKPSPKITIQDIIGAEKGGKRESAKGYATEYKDMALPQMKHEAESWGDREHILGQLAGAIASQGQNPIAPTEIRLYKMRLEALERLDAGDEKGFVDAAGKAQGLLIRLRELSAKEEKAKVISEAMSKHVRDMWKDVKEARKELEKDTPPPPPPPPPVLTDDEAAAAMKMLKAGKQMQQDTRAIEKASKEAKKAGAKDINAYMPKTSEVEDEDVIKEMVESEKQQLHKDFLSMVESKELGGGTAPYYSAGGYDTIADLSLSLGLQGIIDKDTLDAFGIRGAADLMARAIHQRHGVHAEGIKKAIAKYHADTAAKKASDAMATAKEAMEDADRLRFEVSTDPSDVLGAVEKQMEAHESMENARKALGQALGQMESAAALHFALASSPRRGIEAGFDSKEAAAVRGAALGLEMDTDFVIDHGDPDDGGKPWRLRLTDSGADRLVRPFDREQFESNRRAMDIISGKHDEEGYLPHGIISRPDLSGKKPTPPDYYAHPLDIGEGDDVHQKLADYVGARLADGHRPVDVLGDLQTLEVLNGGVHPSRLDDVHKAVDELFPSHQEVTDKRGNTVSIPVPLEKHDERFRQFGLAWAKKQHGTEQGAFHGQAIDLDSHAALEATYRALSHEPRAQAAFVAPADLTHQHRSMLRDFFYSEIAKIDPKKAKETPDVARKIEALGPEPDKMAQSLFGGDVENPEWSQWNAEKTRIMAEAEAGPTPWQKYVTTHGSEGSAYETLQDVLKGRFAQRFHEAHGKLTDGAALKLGSEGIRHPERHAMATGTEEERAAMTGKTMAEIANLRNRRGGQFAGGSIAERREQALQDDTVTEERQGMLFGGGDEEKPAAGAGEMRTPTPMAGERFSLGQTTEAQLAQLVPRVAENFNPKKPVDLRPGLSMSGDFVEQQRAIKLLEAQRKIGVHKGVGSGKSLMSIAGFTHLHGKGKIKRGILAVPSSVQQQFGGEMLRFTDPKQGYRWWNKGGASKAERMAAYRDDSGHHMVVVTHQALRDDILDMVAMAGGHDGDRDWALGHLGSQHPDDRAVTINKALDHHGIHFDYTGIDESQYISGRAGKQESGMQSVLDALIHPANSKYGMLMSGTPVKNDPSEAYDFLRKIRPDLYRDERAFKKRVGVDAYGSKVALQREIAPHTIAGKIDPKNVTPTFHSYKLPLTPHQQSEYKKTWEMFRRAARAQKRGALDIEAVKHLSPKTFETVPDEHHENVARRLQASAGILKEQALKRVVDEAPIEHNAKIQHLLEAVPKHIKDGRPVVIFTSRYAPFEMLKAAFEAKGIKVASIRGWMSSEEKERQKLRFHPETGEPEAQVLIATDAAQTGVNLQRGKELYQYDLPMTAAAWEQRNGRIYRTGQTGEIGLHDLTTDTDFEREALARVKRKRNLGSVFQDNLSHLDDSGLASYLHKEGVRLFQGQDVKPSDRAALDAGLHGAATPAKPNEEA